MIIEILLILIVSDIVLQLPISIQSSGLLLALPDIVPGGQSVHSTAPEDNVMWVIGDTNLLESFKICNNQTQ